MVWGAIGAALGQAAGVGISNNLAQKKAKRAEQRNYAFQKEMQKNQLDWEREKFETSYQTAVNDLKKAGLNPVLAAMNGGNSAGSIGGGSGTDVAGNAAIAGGKNISNAISNGIQNSLELKRIKETQRLNNSVIDKNNADADLTTLNSTARRIENSFLSNKQKKELENLDYETLKKRAEIKNIELNNDLNLQTMNSKVIQELGEAEKKTAEGKSAHMSLHTLETLGLTREEVAQLKVDGIKAIANLVQLGVGGVTLKRITKTLVKNGKLHMNSAKSRGSFNRPGGY